MGTDLDFAGIEDSVTVNEVLTRHLSLELAAITDIAAVDTAAGSPKFLVGIYISPTADSVTVTEAVSIDDRVKFVRGTNSAMIEEVDADWALIDKYPKFVNGFPLKGIVLMPGSGDSTFVIRDGENGPFLYSGVVTANTLIVYPGALCKPFIDYSECTLSTGNVVNFIW